MERNELCRSLPLFQGLSAKETEVMLEVLEAQIREYPKGALILCEGDTASVMGAVLTGSVYTCADDCWGNRNILTNISANGMFGMAFAISSEKNFPLNVISAEPSEILLIDRKNLEACVQSRSEYPEINLLSCANRLLINLLSIMADITIALKKKIEIISQKTTHDKLLAYLMFVSKQANSTSFDIPYNRQELADFLGVERSAMTVQLGILQSEGRIRVKKNHFELLEEIPG